MKTNTLSVGVVIGRFQVPKLHASRNPLTYGTVDIAIIRPETREVLLAGKNADGGKLRFIGGFVDPSDTSIERAAKREAFEETSGMEVDELRYLGSARVSDWRYRGTEDGIMTSFFAASYIFGAPRPADDIDHLEWVPYARVRDCLIESHRPLCDLLAKHLAL